MLCDGLLNGRVILGWILCFHIDKFFDILFEGLHHFVLLKIVTYFFKDLVNGFPGFFISTN